MCEQGRSCALWHQLLGGHAPSEGTNGAYAPTMKETIVRISPVTCHSENVCS